MLPTLLAWIGKADLDACHDRPDAGLGPVARAVEDLEFDRIVLLDNSADASGEDYCAWLAARTAAPVELRRRPFDNPTDYALIYRHARAVAEEAGDGGKRVVFHLSPGTSAMAAVWIFLSKTLFHDRSELIQSSRERGVETVDVPFDVFAEFAPEILRRSDDALVRLTQGLPPEAPEFESIVHRCDAMRYAVALARRLAPRDVPVLIQGESGTGKELFARAIHNASSRRDAPFVAVNCGAIPAELVDSELFGHKKGAFTGAVADRQGVFEEATGGTLFLDEVGELAKPAQVRLLRALQEKKVRRVGENRERAVDVRVIAATNRDLVREMDDGAFREDLFHRLAVGILVLPPLREREGDVGPLIDHLLDEIQREAAASQPGYAGKKISLSAKSLLLTQPWPGNVRELRNVLLRASLAPTADTISVDDVRRALLPRPRSRGPDNILTRPLGGDFKIDEVLAEVERIYIERALIEARRQVSKTARLLGLGSHQTLANRMKKLGMKR